MKKAFDMSENIINFLGVGFALTDVNNIINLILLIVSVLAILVRSALEIRDHFKSKQYDKIDDTLNDAIDDIGHLKDSIANGDEHKYKSKEKKDNGKSRKH